MPYDSQGVFTRVMNWQEDAANSVPIVASRHDDEDDNFAQGFNEVLCRDGRAAMTGNLKMGLNKITGVANGTTTNDAVNKSQLDAQNTSLTTAISTAITNCKNALFPVGSLYSTIGNTNPNSLLGFGTWSLVISSVITAVDTNVPCKGNGKGLGIFNGSATYELIGLTPPSSGGRYHLSTGNQTTYNNIGDSTSLQNAGENKILGISPDSSNSGIVGTVSRSVATIYVWQRTA